MCFFEGFRVGKNLGEGNEGRERLTLDLAGRSPADAHLGPVRIAAADLAGRSSPGRSLAVAGADPAGRSLAVGRMVAVVDLVGRRIAGRKAAVVGFGGRGLDHRVVGRNCWTFWCWGSMDMGVCECDWFW